MNLIVLSTNDQLRHRNTNLSYIMASFWLLVVVKQSWHSIGFQFQFFMWPANRFWNNYVLNKTWILKVVRAKLRVSCWRPLFSSDFLDANPSNFSVWKIEESNFVFIVALVLTRTVFTINCNAVDHFEKLDKLFHTR